MKPPFSLVIAFMQATTFSLNSENVISWSATNRVRFRETISCPVPFLKLVQIVCYIKVYQYKNPNGDILTTRVKNSQAFDS